MAIKEEVWEFPKIGSKKQRIWYTPESVSHPAKMNTLLTRKLITTFTKKGDVILDPMAGVGTTLVEGMLLGRNVVGVDIEDKFVRLIEGNLKNVEKINAKGWFKLRLGKAAVVKGDSRQLAQLLQDKMDAIVTSPPYANAEVGKGIREKRWEKIKDRKGFKGRKEWKTGTPSHYSVNPENIGNLPHESNADVVITSPPYSGSVSKHAGGDKVRERFEGFMGESQIEARKYSEDEANIGNLADHGKIDVVVTSPPFTNRQPRAHTPHLLTKEKDMDNIKNLKHGYSENPDNIGNLKHGQVDAVVTSPPFASTSIAKEFKSEEDLEKFAREQYVFKHGRSLEATKRFIKKSWQGYPENPENIANLSEHGQVDTVITSPPFANIAKSREGGISPHMQGLISQLSGIPVSEFAHDPERLKEAVKIAQSKIPFKYSDNPQNIGNLPPGKVDVVLTSPPYADIHQVPSNSPEWTAYFKRMLQEKGYIEWQGKHYSEAEWRRMNHGRIDGRSTKGLKKDAHYSDNPENIGNLPHAPVDTIITSPPYSEQPKANRTNHGILSHSEDCNCNFCRKNKGNRGEIQGYRKVDSPNPENVGNLKHGQVDTVITSPPYEATFNVKQHTFSGIAKRDPNFRREVGGYGQSEANIGNLRRGESVDAIVTSPPYEGSVSAPNDPKRRAERMHRAGLDPKTIVGGKARCGEIDWQYSENPQNIGNEKGETYLEAMLKVYREMFKVLKPDGLAIIVLKNFIRNWKVVDLIGDTVKLCEHVGLRLVKRIRFVLPTESFWRTNYRIQYEKKFKKPFPEEEFASVYKYETVLVFGKISNRQ